MQLYPYYDAYCSGMGNEKPHEIRERVLHVCSCMHLIGGVVGGVGGLLYILLK